LVTSEWLHDLSKRVSVNSTVAMLAQVRLAASSLLASHLASTAPHVATELQLDGLLCTPSAASSYRALWWDSVERTLFGDDGAATRELFRSNADKARAKQSQQTAVEEGELCVVALVRRCLVSSPPPLFITFIMRVCARGSSANQH
jgi:hypothetical protein